MKIFIHGDELAIHVKPGKVTAIGFDLDTAIRMLESIGLELSGYYVPESRNHKLGAAINGLVTEHRMTATPETNRRAVKVRQSIQQQAELDVGLSRHHVDLSMSSGRGFLLIYSIAVELCRACEPGTPTGELAKEICEDIHALIQAGEIE